MSDAVSTGSVGSTSTDAGASAGVADSVSQQTTTGEMRGSEATEAVETTEGTEAVEPKRYKFEKLKIRGKEVDIDADEDQVKRYIQQAHGANERYEEAKKIREEANTKFAEHEKWKAGQDEFQNTLKTNPIQAAMDAGADPAVVRDMAEKYLLEQIHRDEMTPEARENIRLKQELDNFNKEKEESAKTQKQQQLEAAASEQRKKIVPEIIKHSDEVGMAKTAANIKRVAETLRIAAKRGLPMSIDKAVAMVHEENGSFVQSTIGGQAKAINDAFKSKDNDAVLKIGKEVESFLGPDVLAALQRYGIVKYRSGTPSMPAQSIDTAKSQRPGTEETELSWDDAEEQRKERVARAQKAWENRSAVTAP
jgi:hypothetical protein